MQRLPSKPCQGLLGRLRQPAGLGLEARPVGLVAQQRVAEMRQMHPDLVGAAGLQPAFDQARRWLAVPALETLQHLPVGDRLAAIRPHRDAIAALRMAVERRVHALYRFDKYGGVVILRSASLGLFDGVADEVLAVLLKAVPDWRTDDVAALSELWSGVELEATKI